MPRRELLAPTERVQLFAFPSDEGEMIRLATLARGDLTYIRQHRGDHNRLGLAIQMVYLRHPSRVLPPSEAPYPPLLGIVAAQLKVTPAAWSQYAKRDETRREHLQELLERFELRQFDRSYYRELIDWLMPLALQTTQGMVLAHAIANELRARRILLPTVALIEKMCAIALTRAERETFRRLTSGLTDKHRAVLDAVLLVRPGGSSSTLSWFRQPPGALSANAVLAHLAATGGGARCRLTRPGRSPEPAAAARARRRPNCRLPAARIRAATSVRDAGSDLAGHDGDAHRRDPGIA